MNRQGNRNIGEGEFLAVHVAAGPAPMEMPRGSINGFELIRRVHKDWQEIGALIASGRAAPKPGDVPDGTLFIGKPIHPGTLIQLIKYRLTSAR